MVVEKPSRGEVPSTYTTRRLKERMHAGHPVDDQIANLIVAQLLHLESEDPTQDISLTSTRGWPWCTGLAITHDAYIKHDVSTICVGMAMRWAR